MISLHNMLPFELTKDTPYLALSGELWSVFYEYFNRNWSCYKEFLLYMCIMSDDDLLIPCASQGISRHDIDWDHLDWEFDEILMLDIVNRIYLFDLNNNTCIQNHSLYTLQIGAAWSQPITYNITPYCIHQQMQKRSQDFELMMYTT